ncbi:MAG: hypothetical protein ACI9S8_003039 [Chlamydiales bacterium]|jgi:hypothetical protein
MLPNKTSKINPRISDPSFTREASLACQNAINELRRSIYQPSKPNTEALINYITLLKTGSSSSVEKCVSPIFSENTPACVRELEDLLIKKLAKDFSVAIRKSDTRTLNSLF